MKDYKSTRLLVGIAMKIGGSTVGVLAEILILYSIMPERYPKFNSLIKSVTGETLMCQQFPGQLTRQIVV